MKSSHSPAHLLLVDDDRYLVESMSEWLKTQGFVTYLATNPREAQSILQRERIDIALVDVRLGDDDGFELLRHCHREQPQVSVIMMTGYGSIEMGVEALRGGAFDLLTKPLIDDELLLAISRALAQHDVIEENRRLQSQLDNRYGLEHIIGHDPRMQRSFEIIESVADTRATILITGQSGTGKSLLARAIHRRSARRNGPFIEIACGALPESLLESELFGHVAGAFTGATTNRDGKFKLADGGTIFLDEIGTASPALQVKLLRVLQELEFEQVGGTKTLKVDTRVILATNDDLAAAVAAGRFRQDLYYRINVIHLQLPPLRERTDDIPSLAEHFLKNCCRELGKHFSGFTPEAMAALRTYAWPGNVRELQNIIERAVLLGKRPQIGLEDLPSHFLQGQMPIVTSSRPDSGRRLTLKEALEGPERKIILQTLRENNWSRNATAEQLGINRTTLYKKMRKLGLETPAFVYQD